MRRKLAMLGLAVPLVAFIAILIYLYLFGTSEPTFEAATRDLAQEHTVVLIREQPPAALIVPDEPPDSLVLVVVLPDDERHVWSALRDLGLLDHVEPAGLGLVPATVALRSSELRELAALTHTFIPVDVDGMFLAGFAGSDLDLLCAGESLRDDWSGVVVVEPAGAASPADCGGAPVFRIDDGGDSAGRIVTWMLDRE